ncbi:LamG-like jellyroll fold domain-containing protein [Telluribacter sp.]|jgi:hypothetical protein|uniref:LamG-like jellyroll fold domain-containing protein n=1 Tax=Telluribacter sp. TaxID=1978767 RepID=UPI002E0FA9DD|nr:LamG-like jellyroll fold domain-containing protein [Telluribacter sp.]
MKINLPSTALSLSIYLSLSISAVWLLGCYGFDLPKREFPKCDQTPVQLNIQSNLLTVDLSLTSKNSSIDKVEWFFGDGKYVTTSTLQTKHTFLNPGTYKVNVTITNICGDVTTLTKDILVENIIAPTVITEEPANVSTSMATIRMAISSNGNGQITRYGICYSTTNSTPLVESDATVKTEGNLPNNSFATFSLSNLVPNKTYYVRGYASNSAGTGYGSVKTFQTRASPVVTIVNVSSIGRNEATVTLKLDDVGNPPATHVGIIFSPTNSAPTFISNDKQYIQVPANSAGINTSIKLTLKPNTSYFYRAFAINAIDTSYSNINKLTTLGEDLTLGQIAYYPLNNSGRDDSGNKYNGQIQGASPTSDRCGNPNMAYSLDGINDYIILPYTPTNLLSYSFSVWVNVSDPNQGPVAISQFRGLERSIDSPAKSLSLFFDKDINDNNAFKLNFGLDGDHILKTIKVPFSSLLNQWVHVVAVWQGSANTSIEPNQMKLYLNGTQVMGTNYRNSERGGNAPLSATSTVIFGYHQVWNRYFKGKLDDIRIYEKALNDAEVMQLWQQEKSCL